MARARRTRDRRSYRPASHGARASAPERATIAKIAAQDPRATLRRSSPPPCGAGADADVSGLPEGYHRLLGPAFIDGTDLSPAASMPSAEIADPRAVDSLTPSRSLGRSAATLAVRGQHQLSTLSGTDGSQPGMTGKQPTAQNRRHSPSQDPHQRHDLRLLPHVKPGDGPTDDHALDLRRALENGEARGGARSFRR